MSDNIEKAEIAQLRGTVRTLIETNDRQAKEIVQLKSENDILKRMGANLWDGEVAASDEADALKARVEVLEEGLREALTAAESEWAQVKNHPASRYAGDVEYFRKTLNQPKKESPSE